MEFCLDLWNVYADEFMRRWGIDRQVAALVGARGKQVFAAEFYEHGGNAYRDSVLLPIRNAWYAAAAVMDRWEILKMLDPSKSLLDYGCGVGMQLLFLRQHGFTDLYAHDIPGIQHDVMQSVTERYGIAQWDGRKVETVICINVLEHVENPVELLTTLMQIGTRVIANICLDHDTPHIAPEAELEKCRTMLTEHGGLYLAA